MKLGLLLFSLFYFCAASVQALSFQSDQCTFDETQSDSFLTSAPEVALLLPNLIKKAQVNPLNADQWEDFLKLVTKEDIEPYESSISIQNLPGCPEYLALSDPAIVVEPGTKLVLKNYAFQMIQGFDAGVVVPSNGLGSIALNKVYKLTGNILINAQCDSPLNCSELVQVYIKNIKVEVFRLGTVGGSTSAGGIIQFQ